MLAHSLWPFLHHANGEQDLDPRPSDCKAAFLLSWPQPCCRGLRERVLLGVQALGSRRGARLQPGVTWVSFQGDGDEQAHQLLPRRRKRVLQILKGSSLLRSSVTTRTQARARTVVTLLVSDYRETDIAGSLKWTEGKCPSALNPNTLSVLLPSSFCRCGCS